jgi:acetyl-CoA carboxylase biotin carboxyl carrier protein
MNINEIQDLIAFVAKSGVSEVEIERKDFKIVIKAEKPEPVYVQASVPQVVAATAAVPAPAQASAPAPQTAEAPAAADESKLVTIKSPMIGTFYRSAGPDKDPFVSPGQSVNKGDTICIVEAMKLFNEIESDVSGKIVKVLVDDASPIEYDQPLFLVEPA